MQCILIFYSNNRKSSVRMTSPQRLYEDDSCMNDLTLYVPAMMSFADNDIQFKGRSKGQLKLNLNNTLYLHNDTLMTCLL